MEYRPTKFDVEWMKLLIEKLNINGIWGYKNLPIAFKRTNAKTMALIKGDERDPRIKEQVERSKLVIEEAGYKFVDRRGNDRWAWGQWGME